VNRAVMLRFAACAVIGLGAALLIAALLLSTYTSSRIAKIPLNIDATLVSDGTGTAIDSASLSGDHIVINQNVPLVSQQQISVESPANADVVTLQVGTSVRRTDKQKDTGLLLAIVDTVTLNRKTAMAVSDDTHTGGSVQKPRAFGDENPPTAIPLRHDGLSYRFPFHTEKKTYPYFDPIAQKPFDVNYDTQEDVNGLTTYRFTQNVGYNPDGKLVAPVKYPSLYAGDEDGKVTASAASWGLQGGDPNEQITMTRYYAAQRTFWVDPVSGTIVKETEHANHYFARDPLKPEVTMVDYKITSNEDTVENQVNAARDERDRLALWSRVLPITFTAVGVIALVGGGLLASFSLRTESALTDPGLDRGDEDFFGRSGLEERVPGAEAETEKLPTQRPDARQDPDSPGSDPPHRDPGEPPDSGPPDPSPPASPERG
jgi:Porin PorA